MMIDNKGCLTILAGIVVLGFMLYAVGSLVAGWVS